jgi:hypothetical protein
MEPYGLLRHSQNRHLSLTWARLIQPMSPSRLSNIHFNIVLTPMPGSSKWSLVQYESQAEMLKTEEKSKGDNPAKAFWNVDKRIKNLKHIKDIFKKLNEKK